MGDSVYEFYVNGALIDTITTTPVSWSVATVLLGEGQGIYTSQPASTWWFDEVSLTQGSTQHLGNNGFESNLAGNYLTPNVYGNWCNIHPSRGANRYNDTSLYGTWSGGIKKNIGYGCWLHQDTQMNSLDFSEFKVMMRRSSATPSGAIQASIFLDWDRGGGSIVGSASIVQSNANTISCTAMGITHNGFPPIPDDTWVEWNIRIFPSGSPEWKPQIIKMT